MNAKAEAKESRFDLLKWLLVAVLVVVAVVGNQYFSAQPTCIAFSVFSFWR